MVCVIEGTHAQHYAHELDLLYQLRHKIFVEERGWKDLWKPDGREIDQFDNAAAIHFGVFRDGKPVGYQRLLPTVGPHLLTEVYPWLCETRDIPRGPHIIEWGRTCVAKEYRGGGRPNRISAELFLAFLEYCLPRGITECSGQSDQAYISGFLQLGFDIEPLGLPTHIDDGPVMAVLMRFSEATLEKTRNVVGIRHNVIEPDRVPAVEEIRPQA